MNEDRRLAALAHAMALNNHRSAEEVIADAEVFDAFLNGHAQKVSASLTDLSLTLGSTLSTPIEPPAPANERSTALSDEPIPDQVLGNYK